MRIGNGAGFRVRATLPSSDQLATPCFFTRRLADARRTLGWVASIIKVFSSEALGARPVMIRVNQPHPGSVAFNACAAPPGPWLPSVGGPHSRGASDYRKSLRLSKIISPRARRLSTRARPLLLGKRCPSPAICASVIHRILLIRGAFCSC